MAVALEKFVQQLEDSGIIAGETLKDFIPPKASPKDAEELALELVRKKKLTKFQAEEVSKGKGKALVLGNYVLMEKIGAGGMGQVFKAEHRRMHRTVAIKMLPHNVTKDAAAIARFEREVTAAAKLRHPNIVAADDADCANGVHFLVMELVDGSDLSALVKKNGPFSIDRAVNYILQAAKGLEFAHKKGIVHRDIKPANLLLDTDGTVKILDMGLARLSLDSDDAPQADLTSTGTIMGTVDYMAPEQALDTKTADARADIYAMGCSLYFLLTGRATYGGDTLMKKLLAHREEPIPSLRSVRAEVPEQLEAVFKKMVAKKIENRYQTMTALIADLKRCGSVQPATQTFQQPFSTAATNTSTISSSQMTSAEATILSTPSAKAVPAKTGNTKKLALIGAAVVAVAMLAVIVVSLKTKEGTLVVEVDQPGATVQVDDQEKVHVSQKGGGNITIGVDPGKHRLKVEKDGFAVFGQEFEMKSGGKTPITAKLVPLENAAVVASSWHGWPANAPRPAIAPFDAEQARKHQEAWAKYLTIPVEYTNSIGMKFRLIPPGEFTMGSTPEEIGEATRLAGEDMHWQECIRTETPQHKVILTQPIYSCTHEVTQAQYKQLMGKNPSHFAPTGAGKDAIAGMDTAIHPVENVSWNDAAEFCAKLCEREKLKPIYSRSGETVTLQEGNGYRLPTEAEWEFSCRAGSSTKYWIGDKNENFAQAGWSTENSVGRTHAVGELKSNPFGIYDTHGNVWEWVEDEWSPSYYYQFQQKSALNPSGPSLAGSQHVLRGGDWNVDVSGCRSSFRYVAPVPSSNGIGFRVALSVDAVRQSGLVEVKKPLAFLRPGFDQWVKDVQAMPPENQIKAVSKKLIELNPGFDGKMRGSDGFLINHKTPTIENGVVVHLGIVSENITDISPVRALVGLKWLQCSGSEANRSKLSDLSPLRGMGLSILKINFTQVDNLSPLDQIPLITLECMGTKVSDLSPLKNTPVRWLYLNSSKVSNLSVLKGMPLVVLCFEGTDVSDLSPIQGMKLVHFSCVATNVSDLSLLKAMPLTHLGCDFKSERDTEILRSIKTLESINGKPVAEFWKEVEEQQKGKKLGFQMPGFDQWIKDVAAMPAEQQVEAVSKKLMELNPGFDGKVGSDRTANGTGTPEIEDGVVVGLSLVNDHVTDISPVRAFVGLKILSIIGSGSGNCRLSDLSSLKEFPLESLRLVNMPLLSDLSSLKGMFLKRLYFVRTQVSDLSPLQGMKLTHLDCSNSPVSVLSPLSGMSLFYFDCSNTLVSDLTPLKDMPLSQLLCKNTQVSDLSQLMKLQYLDCSQSKVSDFSPLKEMPLKKLWCDFKPERDTDLLRSIKTLETINEKPAAEFWKEVEEQQNGKQQ